MSTKQDDYNELVKRINRSPFKNNIVFGYNQDGTIDTPMPLLPLSVNEKGQMIVRLSSTLEGLPDDVKNAINEFRNDVNTRIDEIKQKFEDVKSRLDNIKINVDNLDIDADVLNLNTDELESKIDNVKNVLELIKTHLVDKLDVSILSKFNELIGVVDDLESYTEVIKIKLEERFDIKLSELLNGFCTHLDDIKTTIVNLNTYIQDKFDTKLSDISSIVYSSKPPMKFKNFNDFDVQVTEGEVEDISKLFSEGCTISSAPATIELTPRSIMRLNHIFLQAFDREDTRLGIDTHDYYYIELHTRLSNVRYYLRHVRKDVVRIPAIYDTITKIVIRVASSSLRLLCIEDDFKDDIPFIVLQSGKLSKIGSAVGNLSCGLDDTVTCGVLETPINITLYYPKPTKVAKVEVYATESIGQVQDNCYVDFYPMDRTKKYTSQFTSLGTKGIAYTVPDEKYSVVDIYLDTPVNQSISIMVYDELKEDDYVIEMSEIKDVPAEQTMFVGFSDILPKFFVEKIIIKQLNTIRPDEWRTTSFTLHKFCELDNQYHTVNSITASQNIMQYNSVIFDVNEETDSEFRVYINPKYRLGEPYPPPPDRLRRYVVTLKGKRIFRKTSSVSNIPFTWSVE